MTQHITGIILSGGKSSRMHKDKGLILFDKQPLISHVIAVAEKACNKMMIVSNQPGYEKLNLPVYEDLIKEKGPLGGIYTGLQQSFTSLNLVLGCDMPFLSEELFYFMIEEAEDFDAVIPEFDGRLQPLCGLYSKNCISHLKKCIIDGQHKMQEVVTLLRTKVLTIDNKLPFYTGNLFTNINTEEDFTEAQKIDQ